MKKTRLWILLLAAIALVVRWVQGTKDKLGTGLDSIKDTVEGAADTVADGAGAVVDWAADLAEGAADAVVDGADAVVDWAINLENSSVTWAGRSGPKSHNGTVDIKAANISMTDGEISWGNVVLDMESIVTLDISSDWLDDHLRAEDFFDVANHPTASFEITKVEGDSVTGDLSIKGTTLPVTVPVTKEDDGARATFSIDGTKWGVNKWGVKDALVSDTIDLEIFLAY